MYGDDTCAQQLWPFATPILFAASVVFLNRSSPCFFICSLSLLLVSFSRCGELICPRGSADAVNSFGYIWAICCACCHCDVRCMAMTRVRNSCGPLQLQFCLLHLLFS